MIKRRITPVVRAWLSGAAVLLLEGPVGHVADDRIHVLPVDRL